MSPTRYALRCFALFAVYGLAGLVLLYFALDHLSGLFHIGAILVRYRPTKEGDEPAPPEEGVVGDPPTPAPDLEEGSGAPPVEVARG